MNISTRAHGVRRRVLLLCALTLLLLPLVTAFCPSQPVVAASAKADTIGVNGNAFPWEAHWNEFQGLLNDSNAGWARLELRWDFIEASPGAWNFGLHDQLVDGYRAEGMQVLGLLDYSVAWANGQAGSATVFGPPTDLDAWSHYVSAVAQHYKGRVSAYEIWNEPDAAFFWNGQDGGEPERTCRCFSARIRLSRRSIRTRPSEWRADWHGARRRRS